MRRAIILVDNLRIGGFQRLALDQAYGLSQRDFEVTILVLDQIPDLSIPSFLHTEAAWISSLNIQIASIGQKRSSQIKALFQLCKREAADSLVISHSLRATALFFLVNQNPLHKIKINTTIHQLPTLSRPKQRLQRFIYAQLSGNLFAYSGAVKSDWEKRSSSNFLSRLFLARKKIKVLRNGIFLDRLPDIKFHNSPVGVASTHGRLIYLGRNTAWKGVGTFLEIAAVPRLLDFKLLFMIPDMHDLQIDSLDKSLQERITVIAGKSIAYYEPTAGDVHLYPANYGHQAEFVESISLNCLELACLGISSFVSAEGLGTWPDLVDSGIFIETDWIDKVALAELIVVKSKIVRTGDEINFLRSKIDIKNQLTELINSPS